MALNDDGDAFAVLTCGSLRWCAHPDQGERYQPGSSQVREKANLESLLIHESDLAATCDERYERARENREDTRTDQARSHIVVRTGQIRGGGVFR